MIKILPVLLMVLLFASCGPSRDPLTVDELSKEKEAVKQVLKAYNKAFEDQNFAGILPTLSQDVIFFGTDSADVITSLNDFKRKITEQFKNVSNTKYGEMTDVSIQMDPYGYLASIIYGIPVNLTIGGKQEHMFLRVARTLKKEDNKWVIVSGIIGVAGGTNTFTPVMPAKPE